MSWNPLRRFGRRSPRWDEVTLLAVDLETSGLDPRRDQILSVAMLPIRGGVIRWGEHLDTLVRPERSEGLTGPAVGVHRILPGELHAAPPLADVLPRILERLRDDAVLLAHHARLDVAFLRRACRRHGHPWPGPRVIDTRHLLARLDHRRHRLDPHPEPLPRELAALREHLGLPAYPRHRALPDALATAEAFLVLRHRLGAERLAELW